MTKILPIIAAILLSACASKPPADSEEICLDCCNEKPQLSIIKIRSIDQTVKNHIYIQNANNGGSADLIINHPGAAKGYPFYAAYLALKSDKDDSGNIVQETTLMDSTGYLTAAHISGEYLTKGVLFVQYDNRRYCLSGVAYAIDIDAINEQ